MDKSPCIGCRLEKEDKNNPVCRECEKRVRYVAGIGPMTCSLPMKSIKKGFKMNKEKTKICTKCGEEKPLTPEFWVKNKGCPDGFAGYCKACKSEQNRIWHAKKSQEKAETGNEKTKKTISTIIELDFKNYPEQFARIEAVAKEEFRSPGGQVMYWICKSTMIKQD